MFETSLPEIIKYVSNQEDIRSQVQIIVFTHVFDLEQPPNTLGVFIVFVLHMLVI